MNEYENVSFSSLLNPGSSFISSIEGMEPEDIKTANDLMKVWRAKYPKNLLRTAFYDGKQRFRNLGISIPDKMAQQVGVVVGWPQKSVRALADKSVFEGFETTDDSMGIDQIVMDNELQQTMAEAVISCYKHSCSFLTVDMDPNDPTGQRVLIMPRAADWSAAIWNYETRSIASALTITGNDRNGMINSFNMWLPGRNYACRKDRNSRWTAIRQDNLLGRVAVVPLAYDRQMDKPFGRSRINSTLMHLTDMAVRTMVRMEGTAEFYAIPKLWFLGLDPEALKGHEWSSLISKINSISRDENDEVPEMKQVTQASMAPHSQMLETIAMMASAETDIPPENLGIRLANPTSAEALAASENQLTRVANRQNTMFGAQLKQALSMAIQLRDNTLNPPDLSGIRPVWAPTREVSDAARADWYTKVASQNKALADSDVGLARLGLSMDELRSFRAYQQSQRAKLQADEMRRALFTNVNEKEDGNGQAAEPPETSEWTTEENA